MSADTEIHDTMPKGYRYATAAEAEVWETIPGAAQMVARHTPPGEFWTDIIVPAEHDWWTWLSTPWSDEFRAAQVTDWENFQSYVDPPNTTEGN